MNLPDWKTGSLILVYYRYSGWSGQVKICVETGRQGRAALAGAPLPDSAADGWDRTVLSDG